LLNRTPGEYWRNRCQENRLLDRWCRRGYFAVVIVRKS
jgi:hypothetical protein